MFWTEEATRAFALVLARSHPCRPLPEPVNAMTSSSFPLLTTRRHWLRNTGMAACATVTGAGLAALSGSAQAHSVGHRALLRVGDQKGNLHALLDAAGALRDLPYDIQWTEFPAAAPLAEALNAEAVDVGPIGDAPLLFNIAAGVRIKAFAVSRSDPYGTAVLVRPDSPWRSAADLKGRSIGPNRGSIGQYVALRALAQAGLGLTDAQFRFLPPAEAKLALTQGALDAWATWEPYTAIAEAAGQARVLVNGRGLSSGLSFLAATDRALSVHKAVLSDFAQRIQQAQVWSYQHMADYSATLSRIIGIPLDAARLQFERRATQWIPIDDRVLKEQQDTADFFLRSGLLRQRLDVRTTVVRM